MTPHSAPNLCRLTGHILKRLFTNHYSFRAKLGLLCVVLNVPIGWGGAAICSYIGLKHHTPILHILSLTIYCLSWGILFLGVWLAGKDTVRAFKQRIPRARLARQRLIRAASAAQP